MGNLIALLIRNVKETYEAGSIAMRPEKMLGKTWETERRWIALKGFMNKEYIQAGETLLYYTLIDTDRSAHKRVIQLMDTVNVPRKQKTLIYDPRKAEQKLKGFKPEIIQKLKEVIFEITFNANLNNLTRGAAPRKTYVLLGPPGTGKTFASIVIPNVINVPYVLEKLEGPLHDLIGLENVKSSILSQARAKALTQPNGQNFICILDDADRDMNKQTIARSSHLALFDESLPAYNDNYLKVSVPYPKFIILTSNYTLKDSALSNRVQTTIDFEDPFTEEGKVNIYIEYLHELINKYKGLPYAPMSEDFTKEDIQNMLSLIKEAEIKADDKGIRTGKHCVMEFFNRKAQEKYLDAMKQQRRQ
jgi:ATP-dependent Lon protease